MDGEEDWMLRPIRSGLLPFSSLRDESYDLEDFMLANEVLDVEHENEMRARAHQESLRGSKNGR